MRRYSQIVSIVTRCQRALADELRDLLRPFGLRDQVRQGDDAVRLLLPEHVLVHAEGHLDVLAGEVR